MRKRRRALVLLSGGIDSTACVQFLLDQERVVSGLFIDYGQAAAERECQSAGDIADHFGIPLQHVSVVPPRRFGTGEIRGRNAWLVLTAYMYCGDDAQLIALGIHRGAPYYDCSQAFVASVNRLLEEYSDGRVTCLAPFAEWTKASIFEYCRAKRLPLALTYSCEAGSRPPCGKCHSCLDRGELDETCEIYCHHASWRRGG